MIIVKKKRTGGSTMTAADERDLVAEGDEELENEQAEKEKEQEGTRPCCLLPTFIFLFLSRLLSSFFLFIHLPFDRSD